LETQIKLLQRLINQGTRNRMEGKDRDLLGNRTSPWTARGKKKQTSLRKWKMHGKRFGSSKKKCRENGGEKTLCWGRGRKQHVFLRYRFGRTPVTSLKRGTRDKVDGKTKRRREQNVFRVPAPETGKRKCLNALRKPALRGAVYCRGNSPPKSV